LRKSKKGKKTRAIELNHLLGETNSLSACYTVMVTCSPYLLRPLRTLRQACSDISASHPELIPPGIDVYPNVEKYAEYDYALAIKNKGRPPKPWRWEIYTAGKSKPVEQSEFFETMSEATRTGKAALAELQAKRVA
jgi:hypothetical protein